MKALKQAFYLFITAGCMAAVLLFFAFISGTGTNDVLSNYSQEEIEAAKKMRDTSFDPKNPLRCQQEVDYSKGASAEWFPKGEPGILEALVASGVLPPVSERVGSEPCVIRGVDGIGK